MIARIFQETCNSHNLTANYASPHPRNLPLSQSVAFGLFRGRVDFKNTERIPFGVNEISLPARSRDSEFREGNLSAEVFDSFCHIIEAFDLYRTHKGIRPALRRRGLRRTFEQTASRSTRFYAPILNRKSVNFFELPTEDSVVKIDRPTSIISLYFEIKMSVHRFDVGCWSLIERSKM